MGAWQLPFAAGSFGELSATSGLHSDKGAPGREEGNDGFDLDPVALTEVALVGQTTAPNVDGAWLFG